MDANQFLQTYGVSEAERVAQSAGTNLDYFRQLARKHRYPSVKLAQRLVDASGDRLDFVLLLKRPEKGVSATALVN